MRSDHDTGNTGALRLSVVIPTYNCLSYLDECLRSVLRQLPDDCELIAVDDGSDDGTAQALAGYVDAHPRFRFVLCEHSGASGARNTGLDLARGAYVTFIDCDDCLREGFLACSLPMLSRGADLYIFGIERIPLSGIREYWTVQDRVYPDASAFADEYVRIRQLMIYSNCNKFYRRCIIEKLRLRFAEGIAFGEDRLFNYRYLTACGCVVTSSQIMLQYIQRSDQSMSSRHIPAYFSLARGLHEAKMDCILRLSGGTTETEKLEFIAYDVSREIEKTLDRFALHPEEKEENLPAIDRIIFGAPCEAERPIDVLVVLGSRNCGYKIRRALEIGMRNPGVKYIVSGANPHMDGTRIEAEFMAEWLKAHGVAMSDVFVENRAKYTRQNLEFSAGIIHALRAETNAALSGIGILTGGFHIPRTRLLAANIPALAGEDLQWFPAYGPVTRRDNWFETPEGRDIVLQELRKTIMLRGAADWGDGQ